MQLSDRIAAVIEPTVEEMGYDLVRVQIEGRQRLRVQIMAERRDRQPMGVEDCAELSRAISALLDVADPVADPYTLEVSSPGIDRPLVRLADFDRFQGFEARIELDAPIDNRRRFQGRLLGTDDVHVRLTIGDVEVRLPHARIARAKLVLTDDLLAAAAGQPHPETGSTVHDPALN